jgi:hypothetical protein
MSEQTSQAINRSLTLSVTGCVNNGSGLCRITVTPQSRVLRTGDRVVVAGVGGVAAANGSWTVNVVSGTQYDLVGSAFAGGPYTSGGTVKRTG